MGTDVSGDTAALEHLDFEPACGSIWHKRGDVPVTEEEATHYARSKCGDCGRDAVQLLGPACVEKICRDAVDGRRYWCIRCLIGTYAAASVRLTPL